MNVTNKTLLPECEVDLLLRKLMSKWTAHILWILLMHGEQRFGYLRKQLVYVSPKVLTDRLRMLEDEGYVVRTFVAQVPPKVSYRLSDRGAEIAKIVHQLVELAAELPDISRS
ncbi:winged helix-turn-helix transcriptional regulator [Phaeobacter porticola]|uniref:Transcriptional regulator, HxlR family n=1 Tax=Phaeobacter porticola TaxID=1844006 RepID=A0A1L3I5Z4_9RHOB|nr:helix-turn-helix domain-containing protein [Phaeobacter porticola]APG47530.1 transcriptional regulator, HxlR family [Phaeobacter porticola]